MKTGGSPDAPMLGRDADWAALDRQMARGQRLVAVLGPAGIGKSLLVHRWADAHATQLIADVRLSRCRSLLDALDCIGRSLGLGPAGEPGPAQAQIAAALAQSQGTVLVLDGIDPVLGEVVTLLRQWLPAQPRLQVICTSRRRLPVPGGAALRLAPLDAEQSVALLRLAHERSAGPGAGARLPAGPLRALATALEGVPLALALVAARLGELEGHPARDPEALARLATQITAPEGERHGSLSRAIDWALGALDQTQRQTLQAAATFRGAFDVAALATLLPPEADAMAVILWAEASSWISPEPDPIDPIATRYRMFRVVRAALVELAAETPFQASLRARHTALVLHRTGRLAERIADQPDPMAIQRLQSWRADLMAIARHPEASPVDVGRAVQVQQALLWYVGPHDQKVPLANLGLAGGTALPSRLRAQLLSMRADGHHHARNPLQALADIDAALDLLIPGTDDDLRAGFLNTRAAAHRLAGRTEAAATDYQQAKTLSAAQGHGRLLAVSTNNLASLHWHRGDPAAAAQAYTEAAEGQRTVGNPVGEAISRSNAAVALLAAGDAALARRRMDAALAQHKSLQNHAFAGRCWVHQAALDLLEGDPVAARTGQAQAARHLRLAALSREYPPARVLAALTVQETAAARTLRTETPDWVESAPRAWCLLQAAVHLRLGERGQAKTALAAAAQAPAPTKMYPSVALDTLARHLAHRLKGPERPTLQIWPQATGFSLGEAQADLRRRGPIRQILARLALAHQAQPGQAIDAWTLIEAGWPGPGADAEAALNRLYVALNTLRKLGLRPVLLTHDDGFMLDPKTPLEQVAAPAPPHRPARRTGAKWPQES